MNFAQFVEVAKLASTKLPIIAPGTTVAIMGSVLLKEA